MFVYNIWFCLSHWILLTTLKFLFIFIDNQKSISIDIIDLDFVIILKIH